MAEDRSLPASHTLLGREQEGGLRNKKRIEGRKDLLVPDRTWSSNISTRRDCHVCKQVQPMGGCAKRFHVMLRREETIHFRASIWRFSGEDAWEFSS